MEEHLALSFQEKKGREEIMDLITEGQVGCQVGKGSGIHCFFRKAPRQFSLQFYCSPNHSLAILWQNVCGYKYTFKFINKTMTTRKYMSFLKNYFQYYIPGK